MFPFRLREHLSRDPRSWAEQAYGKLIYYKNTKTVATRKGELQ
jgi:hypothetical protein